MSAQENSRAQLTGLVEFVQSLAKRRSGVLCALTISASPSLSVEWLRRELGAELERAGFGQVELSVVRRGPDLRLLSAEFDHSKNEGV